MAWRLQMLRTQHQRVANGITASKHQCLGFLVEAPSTRDLPARMQFGVEQRVVDDRMRGCLERFWVLGYFLDLFSEYLRAVNIVGARS